MNNSFVKLSSNPTLCQDEFSCSISGNLHTVVCNCQTFLAYKRNYFKNSLYSLSWFIIVLVFLIKCVLQAIGRVCLGLFVILESSWIITNSCGVTGMWGVKIIGWSFWQLRSLCPIFFEWFYVGEIHSLSTQTFPLALQVRGRPQWESSHNHFKS